MTFKIDVPTAITTAPGPTPQEHNRYDFLSPPELAKNPDISRPEPLVINGTFYQAAQAVAKPSYPDPTLRKFDLPAAQRTNRTNRNTGYERDW